MSDKKIKTFFVMKNDNYASGQLFSAKDEDEALAHFISENPAIQDGTTFQCYSLSKELTIKSTKMNT